jgi:hypothetical protein
MINDLAEIEALAREANIRIMDIRPQDRQDQGQIGETIIELRAEGNMDSYLKFIHSVENSFLLFKIKKFQLNARQDMQILESNFYISLPSPGDI